jgi:hypothetical protein
VSLASPLLHPAHAGSLCRTPFPLTVTEAFGR